MGCPWGAVGLAMGVGSGIAVSDVSEPIDGRVKGNDYICLVILCERQEKLNTLRHPSLVREVDKFITAGTVVA